MNAEKQTHLLNVIEEHCPGLIVKTVKVHEDGQYNDVLILNNELVFRFPRLLEEAQKLETELQMLKLICRRCRSLPLPKPQYEHIDLQQAGQSFMAYAMIPGEPFWRNKAAAIEDEAQIEYMAGQVAEFMYDMHQIPEEEYPQGLDLQDDLNEWSVMYAEFQKYLYPHMRADARREMTREFEGFINSAEMQQFTPCLRHGDYGPSNFLYDPQALRITGIIDFSSAGLGDPATDFSSASCLGEQYTKHFTEFYPDAQTYLKRALFYKSTFALQEALHGAKYNDKRAFESGIANYI